MLRICKCPCTTIIKFLQRLWIQIKNILDPKQQNNIPCETQSHRTMHQPEDTVININTPVQLPHETSILDLYVHIPYLDLGNNETHLHQSKILYYLFLYYYHIIGTNDTPTTSTTVVSPSVFVIDKPVTSTASGKHTLNTTLIN